jgi:predicted AAA+ superfamily ATPase
MEMTKMTISELRLGYSAVSLLSPAFDAPLLSAYRALIGPDELDSRGAVSAVCGIFAAAAALECTGNMSEEIAKEIRFCDNTVARIAAAGRTPCGNVIQKFKSELDFFARLSQLSPDELFAAFGVKNPPAVSWQRGAFELSADGLMNFWSQNGFGVYARHYAFRLEEDALKPIIHADPICLSDLKGYEVQRQTVLDNTEAFTKSLPANDILLYGDRGTGKSATVHALLNDYGPCGLRIVELKKNQIPRIPWVIGLLRQIPLKFIIFIDDLSFEPGDEGFSALKGIMEGSLDVRPSTVLIYVTSNRRHFISENAGDREGGDMRRTDTIQETHSLSDRFGLTVTFLNPNKAQYLDIVAKMAEDRSLDADPDELAAAAERFALSRGGRSPRTARQFIDMAQARLRLGRGL